MRSLPQPATRNSQLATRNPPAFTLIEILLASAAAAMIFIAVYGIFVRAIHLRDSATNRVRDTRLHARAERAIRGDLENALISGGLLASALTGGSNSSSGPGGADLPGYLKLTTTTGRDTTASPYGDVQQVEYYLVHDANAGPAANGAQTGGTLVRAVTRDLMATAQPSPTEEKILAGVQSLQVQFYDGTNWQDSWTYDGTAAAAASATPATTASTSTTATTSSASTTSNTTLPLAIRVDVQPVAATFNGNPPPPIEILVPWTTQPFAAATPDPNSGSSNTGTPTPTPTPTPPGGGGGGGGGGGPGRPGGGGGPGGGGPGGPGGGGPPGGGRPGGGGRTGSYGSNPMANPLPR